MARLVLLAFILAALALVAGAREDRDIHTLITDIKEMEDMEATPAIPNDRANVPDDSPKPKRLSGSWYAKENRVYVRPGNFYSVRADCPSGREHVATMCNAGHAFRLVNNGWTGTGDNVDYAASMCIYYHDGGDSFNSFVRINIYCA